MENMKIKLITILMLLLIAATTVRADEDGNFRSKAIVTIKRIVPEKTLFKRAMASGETKQLYDNKVKVNDFETEHKAVRFAEEEGEEAVIEDVLEDEEPEVEIVDNQAEGTTIESSLYDPDLPEYRIRTSDVLLISIPYEPDSEKTVPVRPDGRITYLFDIEVMAAGLTYNQLNVVLRSKLAKYYKDPQVSVIGKSFAGNSVFVMGPVIKPGKYVIHNDTRLLDILSESGAMSILPDENAGVRNRDVVNLEEAYLARGNEILGVDFKKLLMGRDMSQNILLKPKDFIYIPSSLSSEKKIYIVGSVDTPRVLRFTSDISFIEAITEAGGILSGQSWSRRSYIVRGGVKNPKEIIRANFPDIVSGKEMDIELQNGDIVYIPKNPLFYTNEVLTSVLSPLRTIIELDNVSKNEFTEGRRMYKHILQRTKSKQVDY